MLLNDLFVGKGIDPTQVLVFRHQPQEPKLRKVLPWLAAEKPDVFNAYQQTQVPRVEKAMLKASYVASFIGRSGGQASYIGLYKIGASRPLTREEYWCVPANRELEQHGMRGFDEGEKRHTLLWFELALTDFYEQWKGKLIVGWPPPERVWYRRAHQNEFPVLAILEESALIAGMPEWYDVVFPWEQLSVLPTPWKIKLSQWRGIYYVWDGSDGKGYVGSAYGHDNILGRWVKGYGASGHGGNSILMQRVKEGHHPKFVFSILELVAQSMSFEDIVKLESTWKNRLHTRAPHGLNEN